MKLLGAPDVAGVEWWTEVYHILDSGADTDKTAVVAPRRGRPESSVLRDRDGEECEQGTILITSAVEAQGWNRG